MSALFLAVPLTIFFLFVAPVWLWLHYNRRASRQSSELSQNDLQRLQQLTQDAQRMRDRITTLEEILNTEHPNWRQS